VSSRAASPRVLIFSAVVAVHAGALLLLLAETRLRHLRGETETTPLIVFLFEPRTPSAVPPSRSAHPPTSRNSPSLTTEAEAPAPPVAPRSRGTAIDWSAEATGAAARQVEADEQRARQARALAPEASPMFATRARRPGFHWNYARTHRVEPVPGLGTVIHLNDQCAILLFVIIPMVGCALEKAPVRGDLFEHMHDDPEP
jgi:hypothetical protein